ncbi:hypothetical protein L1987_43502 [Smallanthus sonchifolius]|uniref:Uncharacterized protein n=1 Tax=Smallanthus sonchifolius TaxID=185202 RepID=A0ACB9GLL4_9ASTR|nr:hypothetical protein L1987_43502 [Smallanthus sonchifolius]
MTVLGKRRRGIEPRANSTVRNQEKWLQIQTSQIHKLRVVFKLSIKMSSRAEEEAIEFANDTHYGLAAAVISNDPERCDRVIKALDVGVV